MLITAGLVLMSPASTLVAQETEPQESTATDERATDGKKKKSLPVVPIPIFVTEPAIGYGLGAAVAYFHPRKGEEDNKTDDLTPAFTAGTPPNQTSDKAKKRPPNITGVGGTRGNTLRYEDESGVVAGGVGGRYLFRPEDSLWIGVDIATGPEDTYAYIQMGHAW